MSANKCANSQNQLVCHPRHDSNIKLSSSKHTRKRNSFYGIPWNWLLSEWVLSPYLHSLLHCNFFFLLLIALYTKHSPISVHSSEPFTIKKSTQKNIQLSRLGVVHLGCLLSIHYHRNEMWPLQLNPQVRTNAGPKLLNMLCGTIICMSMWKESDYSSTTFSDTTGTIRRKPRTRKYGDKPGWHDKGSSDENQTWSVILIDKGM